MARLIRARQQAHHDRPLTVRPVGPAPRGSSTSGCPRSHKLIITLSNLFTTPLATGTPSAEGYDPVDARARSVCPLGELIGAA